jgi:hypothetical protein
VTAAFVTGNIGGKGGDVGRRFRLWGLVEFCIINDCCMMAAGRTE